MKPARPLLFLCHHFVDCVDDEIESKEEEDNLDEPEPIVVVKQRSGWAKFEILSVRVEAYKHHNKNCGGSEKIGQVLEAILVGVFIKKYLEPGGGGALDLGQIWKLVTACSEEK